MKYYEIGHEADCERAGANFDFTGGRCPRCGAEVTSFLSWHDAGEPGIFELGSVNAKAAYYWEQGCRSLAEWPDEEKAWLERLQAANLTTDGGHAV